MRRTIWVGLFLLFVFSISGQNQPNPFDLKFRPANSSIPSNPVLTVGPDSLKKQPNEIPLPDTAFTLTTVPDSLYSASGNPFELGKKEDDSTAVAVIDNAKTREEAILIPPVGDRTKPSKGIQIFFLLLSLLFLIFIVNVERSFVRDLWKVISNENYSSLQLRNQRNTMRQILLMMGYLVFIIQAGVFLYRTLDLFGYRGNLLDNVWSSMLLIFMVYLVRHMVITYLRWLFNNEKEMSRFSFDISIFNIMVGLVLLPINVLINFGPDSLTKPLIIIGLIVVITAYLMRQLRWMLTARQLITNSLFLFFIYLCAVEILPLWAISKFFW